MPPKAAAPSSDSGLTAKEVGLLKAMATLMDEAPKIDYNEMADLISMNHAKNAKSALKNLFEKLKKQQNHAAAGSSADADRAATPEGEDGAEEVNEGSPKEKTPARKTRTIKKADDSEDVDDEAKPVKTPKKAAIKKGAATPKSTAAKKGVGKTTAPKKASAGGPKTPAKGKGKGKKGKAEESEPEAEAEVEIEDAEVEMVDADAAAKAEPEDVEVKDVEDAGKFPNSLTQSTELLTLQSTALDATPVTTAVPGQAELSPSQSSAPMATTATPLGSTAANPADPQVLGAEAAIPLVFFNTFVPPPRPPILADPTKPLLEIIIQGWTYYFTPYDVSVAQSHGMSLQAYLQWKEYNDYTYLFPQPYTMEDAQAQAAAERSGKD